MIKFHLLVSGNDFVENLAKYFNIRMIPEIKSFSDFKIGTHMKRQTAAVLIPNKHKIYLTFMFSQCILTWNLYGFLHSRNKSLS